MVLLLARTGWYGITVATRKCRKSHLGTVYFYSDSVIIIIILYIHLLVFLCMYVSFSSYYCYVM